MSQLANTPKAARRRIVVVDSSETVLAGIARQAAEQSNVAVETFAHPHEALARLIVPIYQDQAALRRHQKVLFPIEPIIGHSTKIT